jgi:hypothetical protein
MNRRNSNPALQPFDIIESPNPRSEACLPHPYQHIFFLIFLTLTGLTLTLLIMANAISPWFPGPFNLFFHPTTFYVTTAFVTVYLILVVVYCIRLRRLEIVIRVPWERTLRVQWMIMGSYFLVLFWIILFGVINVVMDSPPLRHCALGKNFPVQYKLRVSQISDMGLLELVSPEMEYIWLMKFIPGGRLARRAATIDLLQSKLPVNANFNFPEDIAVRKMVYAKVLDGQRAMHGFCGKQVKLCLSGFVTESPYLEMQWNYTNPQTGEVIPKKLASPPREWNFGTRHRVFVELFDQHHTLVFSSPSMNSGCGAGDGDLTTALVPAGYVMIQEDRFVRRLDAISI